MSKKEYLDLEGLQTFKNTYDVKLAEEIANINNELATRDALIEELQEKVATLEQPYVPLTYTTTSENEEVQIAYINSYFSSVVVADTGEELLDGTQSEDNAASIPYTFAEAGEHTVYVKVIDTDNEDGLSYLFYNCTALTSVGGGLFKYATSNISFAYTFYYCSSLTSVPEGLFASNTLVTNFSNTFYHCSSLASIPSGLFDNNTAVTTFANTFQSCTSLTSIPSGLFDNNTLVTTFDHVFRYDSKLTTIPSGLFDNCTLVTIFQAAFGGCTSLTSIPSGLFANCPLVTTYYKAFQTCTSLTGETPVNSAGLKLWELAGTDGYPDSITGTDCFESCTGLDDYDEIDDDWK